MIRLAGWQRNCSNFLTRSRKDSLSMSTLITPQVDLRIPEPNVIDIRNLTSRDLLPLLREEIADWAQQLDWDFSKFADLVAKFADARMLTGAALIDRGEVAGYGHTCLEDNRGLITDIYVREGWRTANAEAELVPGVL